MKTSLSVAFIAILYVLCFRIYEHLDIRKVVYDHRPGKCDYIEPIVEGSEDIDLHPDGFAVITSGLRYTTCKELEDVKGKLYFYDFNDAGKKPKAKQIDILWAKEKNDNFNPHGLKIFPNDDGRIHLYVINHEPTGDCIEILELDIANLRAKPIKTIKDRQIYSANNLVVIGTEEFYVSNDAFFKNSFLKGLEFLNVIFPLGSIVFHNRQGQVRIVDQLGFMPNGMAVDDKKKYLFVSSILAKELLVYEIQNDRNLKKISVIPLGTMPDNIFYDSELNGVWLGCHPVVYSVLNYIKHPKSTTSPSQVLFVKFDKINFDNYSIREYFADSGEGLSASTVAVRYKKNILIGTVGHKMMSCEIDQQ